MDNNNQMLAKDKSLSKKSQVLVKYKDIDKAEQTIEKVKSFALSKYRNKHRESVHKTNQPDISDAVISQTNDLPPEETLNTKGVDEQPVFKTRHTFKRTKISTIAVGDEENIEDIIDSFEQDENVAYVQQNYQFEPFQIPEDEYFPMQWALNNTGQEINGIIGTPGIDVFVIPSWETHAELENILVGVIDTGIDVNHQDLSGKTVSGYDFFNDKETVFDGKR